MFKYLILFIIPIISLAQENLNCQQYETRYIYDKSYKYEKKQLCISKNKAQIISKSCKNIDCLKSKKYTSILSFEDFIGLQGSPQFLYCHYLGGIPKLLETKNTNTWLKNEVCEFKNISFENLNLHELDCIYRKGFGCSSKVLVRFEEKKKKLPR